MPNPQDRINYQGDLKVLLDQVCDDYQLGKYKSHRIITHGYEDLNLILETTKEKVFIKIFNKARTAEELSYMVEVLKLVFEASIQVPKLFKHPTGYLGEIMFDDEKT